MSEADTHPETGETVREHDYIVVLTVYKRPHLERQLRAIQAQTVQPRHIVVFQNELHVDVEPLKEEFDFIHVRSDYNTKYFGRFYYCLNFDVDYYVVMDDDIIPGENCMRNYINQCATLDGIIGGNGRYAKLSGNVRRNPPDVGRRMSPTQIDFVGHLWCFKPVHLRTMMSYKPHTLDTGEDMHLCFTNKLHGVNSYVGRQMTREDMCDTDMNQLAGDEFASYKTTPSELRKSVEKYFIEKFDIKFM